jgi:hypothetical protein
VQVEHVAVPHAERRAAVRQVLAARAVARDRDLGAIERELGGDEVEQRGE